MLGFKSDVEKGEIKGEWRIIEKQREECVVRLVCSLRCKGGRVAPV